jgi:branched-chain amino acid transport system ATP-binding protein
MSALLELRDLRVCYGPVLALDRVSLEIQAGGAISLLGPNGAGKTTLLRSISGLLGFQGGRITAGEIRYDGRPVARVGAAELVRRGIAQVLEGRHVFAELTVEENLRAGGFRGRADARTAREKVLSLFPVLGDRLGQPAGLLSGGEQQMLAIGRALMGGPRLLLLDEPSLGLAPLVVRAIGEALAAINAEGVTLLLVEQSSALATQLTRFSYLMDTGEIRASGSTAELLADDAVRSAYLGLAR